MTRVTLSKVDRWAGQGPGFNREVAETVYKALAALPEGESQLFGVLLLDGCNNYELMANYIPITEARAAEVTERAEKLTKYYSREAVAKQRRGEDNTHELACLVEIGKAFPWTFGQRSQYSQQNARGRTRIQGRFAAEHRPVNVDTTLQPRDPVTAAAAFDTPRAQHLEGTPADLQHYQQAYQQVRDLLGPYRNPAMNARLHLGVRDNANNVRDNVYHVDETGVPNFAQHLQPGHRIQTASISVHPDVSSTTAVMAGMHAMGMHTRQAATVAAGVYGLTDPSQTGALHAYNEAASQPFTGNEPYSAATRAFGHLQRGAELLDQGLGENAPLKLQYALRIANHVGQFGPEAQKVIGPLADRTAYRYRGTERTPAPGLVNAFGALHANTELKGQAARRNAAIFGTEPRDYVTRTQSGAIRGTDPDRPLGWTPGPVLDYFRNRLPNPDLNELQRKSGVVPPSEGIVISRGGEIMHQSVGYADDWYLPFNLRHLNALRGGEYIRTRTFGGPTTEDIYAGLVSGAKSLTVVSHNGVYNVTFDRNLRGGRRLNDKAARMVGRYGHLLDALRSGAVQGGGVSSPRRDEIWAGVKADTSFPEGSKEFRAIYNQRLDAERTEPKLSQAERNAAAMQWMDQIADRRGQSTGDMINDLAAVRARKEESADVAAVGRPAYSKDEYAQRGKAAIAIPGNMEATAVNVANALGGRSQENLARFMQKAERVNEDKVSPLALNGKGYDNALHALQEQFPYYIEHVSYRPWTDAIGLEDYGHRKSGDTGYVLPRHNRPVEAQSGYFSPDVYGPAQGSTAGKVRADTTRYQNRRVHQGNPLLPGQQAGPNGTRVNIGAPATPGTPATPGVRVAAPGAAAPAAAAAATPGAPAAAAAAAPTTVEAQQAQTRADLDMLDEVTRHTNFASGARLPHRQVPEGIDFGGANIAGEIANTQFPRAENDALVQMLTRPKQDLQAMLLDPQQAPQVRGWMDQVVAQTERPGKPLDLDTSVVARYKNRGVAGHDRAIPDHPMQRMRELDQDHTFPGVESGAYYERNKPSREYVQRTYDGDPLIGGLRQNNGLPDLDAPQTEWTQRVREISTMISDAAVRQARGETGQLARMGTAGVDRLQQDSMGLLRATQLRRRYNDAGFREPPPLPPAAPEQPPEAPNQYTVNFINFDPDNPEHQRQARASVPAIAQMQNIRPRDPDET